MRIAPVYPVCRLADPPRRNRALMMIHHERHTVCDTVTGERFGLPAKEAWEKYESLNILV